MTTALARPIDNLKVALVKPAMGKWLQKQIHASMNRNAQQLINIALQAASQKDALAKCTPQSVLASLCVAAQIGLVPNTSLGHAYLVPFSNRRKVGNQWISVDECQLIIGYKGYVKLVYDAADLTVQAQPVYEGDEFEYDLASFPPVRRHRHGDERTDDKMIYGWCHLQTKSGRVFGDVMTKADIEKRRAVSKSYLDRDGTPRKDSPWILWKPEMWVKTACRHTLRLAPMGNDERLERALTADDEPATDIIDMSDAPDEMRDDRPAIEQQQRQALAPPQQDEIMQWVGQIKTCTDMKGLDEVGAKIKKLPAEMQNALGKPFIEAADRMRTEGREKAKASPV